MWDVAKAALRGNVTALNAHTRKEERSKINNLNFHFRKQEKEEQIKSKVSRRKEIIKIRAEISETENRKTIEKKKINETKSWFFEKTNKINKPLARLTKKKRGKIQIINTRNERQAITTDPMDTKRIVKDYYEQLNAHKFDKLGEMDQFLERHRLPKLTQEETDDLNRPISITLNQSLKTS